MVACEEFDDDDVMLAAVMLMMILVSMMMMLVEGGRGVPLACVANIGVVVAVAVAVLDNGDGKRVLTVEVSRRR